MKIEAQSTNDRSPLSLQTPKPPRPDKSTILSSSTTSGPNNNNVNAATYQTTASNPSRKNRVLILGKSEKHLGMANPRGSATCKVTRMLQNEVVDGTASQTSADHLKPTPGSRSSASSQKHTSLSTYLSPKVKTSRNMKQGSLQHN